MATHLNLLELLVDSQLEVDGSEDFSGDSEAPLSGGGQLEVNIVGDAVAHDLDIELLGGLVQGWRGGGGGGSCLGGCGRCWGSGISSSFSTVVWEVLEVLLVGMLVVGLTAGLNTVLASVSWGHTAIHHTGLFKLGNWILRV